MPPSIIFFFFNDTATTEIYTLSLHDALPICPPDHRPAGREGAGEARAQPAGMREDRKSTRLNSSHLVISYAVFCLKKKKPVGEEEEEPQAGIAQEFNEIPPSPDRSQYREMTV